MNATEKPAIIDFHCHVAAEMCFPPSFSAGVVDNAVAALHARGIPMPRAKVASMHDATLDDPLCDRLVAEMDDAGIAEAVLLLPDFTYVLRDSTHTIEELIAHHRSVRDRHPGRFRVFLGVDPRWGSDGLTLFERSILEHDFDGMKLYPPCGYRLSDKILYPFYEICQAYGLPVLSHIGATSPALEAEPAQPIFVDRAAKDFPDVDFVLAHGSVNYVEECAMLCNSRPNIHVDVSGYEGGGVAGLARLFELGLYHKVLFATDWPIFRMQGHQASFVERLTTEGAFPETMTARDRDLFFHGNARRLLSKKKLPGPVGAGPRP